MTDGICYTLTLKFGKMVVTDMLTNLGLIFLCMLNVTSITTVGNTDVTSELTYLEQQVTDLCIYMLTKKLALCILYKVI
jgi:hypothetical protein